MILWDVSRASAFVAFACYTLVIAWGMGLSARGWRPAAPQLGFHRFLASLGLVALGLHVVMLLLDRFARVTLSSLVGLDPRPAVTLGAAAMWLAVALPVSFRLKQAHWMSQRAWRGLHYFGYAVWGLALAHGVTAGTDARSPWALALYGASAALVAGVAWHRWLETADQRRPARPPLPERRPTPTPERIPVGVALESEGHE